MLKINNKGDKMIINNDIKKTGLKSNPKSYGKVCAAIIGLSVFLIGSASGANTDDAAELDSELSRYRLGAISSVQGVLEGALRDPGSVEYIVKSYNLDNDAICFKYLAKNGLGGMTVETIVVINGEASQSAKAYKKRCLESANYERYTW